VSVPLDLDVIKARADAATEGPWTALTTGVAGGDHWYVCDLDQSIASIHASDGEDEERREPDAEFIAAARTDVPELLAEVTRLRAELTQAEADVASLCALRDQQEREGAARLARIKDIQDDRAALTAERDALAAWKANAQTTLDYDKAQMDGLVAQIEQVLSIVREAIMAIDTRQIRNLHPLDLKSILTRALATTPADALEAVKAEAWDEGWAVALNHAIRNPDGITLRLEHLDGQPWANPYRTLSGHGTPEPPTEANAEHDHDEGGCTCGCPVVGCWPCGGNPEPTTTKEGE
jgi:hypothetical protein